MVVKAFAFIHECAGIQKVWFLSNPGDNRARESLVFPAENNPTIIGCVYNQDELILNAVDIWLQILMSSSI